MAVDQSTSGTKAILFDYSGKLVYRTNADHKQYYPKPGWVEHDPTEIIQRVYEAVDNLYKATGVDVEQVVALGISNQRETTLIWDRKTGKPVHNAIVWQCQRATDICAEISKQGFEDVVLNKTGLVLSPYFPAAKLKWMLDNVEDLRQRADKGELAFGTIDSWLIWNFTNGRVHATDYSNASRTQLFNIKDKCWDKELLEIFTIPESMAPQVCNSSYIYGYTMPESTFRGKIPISGVLGDSHAALFGQNCFGKGMTKTTYGTGSSIMMNIGKEPLASNNGIVTSIGWGIDDEIEYVFEGNINCTGSTIKWLVDELELIPNSIVTEGIAKSIDDNDGVYFVPAFVGLSAPYWDSNARASILGMTRGTKKAHVVRAALEAIAYQIKDVVDLMVKEANITLKELRVDGGATANSFLMQFQSDMLNVPVVCASIEELSAIGAAYMAGMIVGFWKNQEELQSLRSTRAVYNPVMDDKEREKLYTGWKEAVNRALTI